MLSSLYVAGIEGVPVETQYANIACLFGRMARVGHRLAARRKSWVRQEECREVARRAHWAVNVVGWGVYRGRGN